MQQEGDTQCIPAEQLRELARRALEAEAWAPETGGHLNECAACRGRLSGFADAELDRLRSRAADTLAHSRGNHATIVKLLVDTHPRAWPPPARWPEVEALGDYLTHLSWLEGPEKLAVLLRDFNLLPERGARQAETFRHFLKQALCSIARAEHRAVYAFCDGSLDREARAYEQTAELEEEPAAALWRGAALQLDSRSNRDDTLAASQPDAGTTEAADQENSSDRQTLPSMLSTPPLAEFRRSAMRALDTFLGDGLTREIIQPLEHMGWDGAAVYLCDASGSMLQVVAASDSTAVYTVQHPIQSKTPDIEVDVFRKQRAERIVGGRLDERFNRYLYTTSHHERFLDRLFVPLVLMRSTKTCEVRTAPYPWLPDGHGYWRLETAPGLRAQVIGNVSVSSHTVRGAAEIEETLSFLSGIAPIAHAASFSGLCERVLAELIANFGAQHGALHIANDLKSVFDTDPRAHPDLVLRRDESGHIADAPRPGGIGAEAVARGRSVHLRGSDLAARNSRLANAGVVTTTAAPVRDVHGGIIGVVYLHYDTDRGESGLDEFASDMGAALGAALRVQRRAMLRAHVLAEAKGFARPPGEQLSDRLGTMAEFSLNILGCDHVSLVVTAPETGRPTRHAGKCMNNDPSARDELTAALASMKPPSPEPIYIKERVAEDPIYRRGRFCADEEIESTAIVSLRDHAGVVGFLVADYRSRNEFGPEYEPLIRSLTGLLAAGVRVFLPSGNKEQATRAALTCFAELEVAVAAADRVSPALPEVSRSGFMSGHGWRDWYGSLDTEQDFALLTGAVPISERAPERVRGQG